MNYSNNSDKRIRPRDDSTICYLKTRPAFKFERGLNDMSLVSVENKRTKIKIARRLLSCVQIQRRLQDSVAIVFEIPEK